MVVDQIRQVIFYKHYFEEFFNRQTEKVKEKIDHILFVITIADRIPVKFFKHVEGTDGLYEIRVEYGGNIYRIFSCLDEGRLVVLLNGFQKKSQKTPFGEIDKALKLKQDYFEETHGPHPQK